MKNDAWQFVIAECEQKKPIQHLYYVLLFREFVLVGMEVNTTNVITRASLIRFVYNK